MTSDSSLNSQEGQLYVSFMQELKVRLFAVRDMLSSLPNGGGHQGFLTAESCFLQVRFICELMALACLAAHEPIGLSKRLLKEWHADDIFKALGEINDQCFPSPISIGGSVQKGTAFHVQPHDGLKRGDLREIYNGCGAALHRGVLQTALAGQARNYDLDQVNRWCVGFWKLLQEHILHVPQLGRVFLVKLDPDPNVPVQLILAAAE